MAGAPILGSKNPDHLGSPSPQPLQFVVLSLLRSENMHNHIAKIQQHPTGSVSSFTVKSANLLILQGSGDVFL